MPKKTFIKLFQMMKGYRSLYLIGVFGFALLLLFFQIQIALLFLELFNAIQAGTFTDILNPIIRFSVIILALLLAIPLFAYFTAKAAIKTTAVFRDRLFHKMTVLALSDVKTTHSAELSSLATNDLNEVEKAYTTYFFMFFVEVIVGVGAGIAMFIIEWRLALVAFGVGILTFIINTLYAKRLRTISHDVQSSLANLNTKLSNILAGMHVIRVFNIQRYVLKIFTKSNQKTLDVSLVRVHREASITALNTLIFSLSFAGITLIGGYLVLEGMIMLGVIVAIVQLQNSIMELVSGLGTFITNMQTSLAAGDRIFAFLEREEEPKSYPSAKASFPKNTTVGLHNVVFGYDEKPIIDGISFSIRKGETLAFVGPSGGGKSTLFKLILHYYPLNQGSITLNGQSTDGVPLTKLRASIAYVPQDAFLFNTTIKENIRYAKPDAKEEAIRQAAMDANAHEFIEALDHGYETLVGEQGTKLSGGQRQRIAIARALLKDAPILLLDEATSALDTQSERLVQEALNRLKKKRTTLIIAHRLSTIQDANRILVVDRGKIIEEGTHETLLRDENSLYAKLYKTRTALESN